MRGIIKKTLLFITLSICIIAFSACGTVLKLPKPTNNMDSVYLLKYSTWGHHSLAFYDGSTFTEFTYGDWDLFALNKRDAWTAWKNMTFLTQGALGRKSISLKSKESICDKFVGCERVVRFLAPKNKVKMLFFMLQKKYNENINTEIYNSNEDVYFVKDVESYWGLHNCNHQLVEWLELLGVEVTGRVFYKPDLIEGMIPSQKTIIHMP